MHETPSNIKARLSQNTRLYPVLIPKTTNYWLRHRPLRKGVFCLIVLKVVRSTNDKDK